MDFAPAWFCARECLDCTLQRAVRARRTYSSHDENPCPPEKVAAIKQAFRHFGLL